MENSLSKGELTPQFLENQGTAASWPSRWNRGLEGVALDMASIFCGPGEKYANYTTSQKVPQMLQKSFSMPGHNSPSLLSGVVL